jgi:aspartate 1-decarboxylase
MMQQPPSSILPTLDRYVTALYAKIHRATVTHADLDYEGSLSIDEHLLELSGIRPHQAIDVYNITNGNRFSTYAVVAPAHSHMIQVNGAAAHLTQPGDMIIIASYCSMPLESLTPDYQPTVVLVDGQNRPTQVNYRPHLAAV